MRDDNKTSATSIQPGMRRFQFSLARLFVAITLFALVLTWPRLLLLAIPIAPFFLLNKLTTRGASLARYGLIIAAVYLPAVPGLFSSHSHTRQMWWQGFPLIPGMVPAAWVTWGLGFDWIPQWIGISILALIICGWITTLYLIGARGKVWFAAAVLLGTAWSAFSSYAFYSLTLS